MNVIPVPGEPLLLLEPDKAGGGSVLVAADLHIGLEAGLRRAGLHLPSQTNAKAARLLKAVKRTGAERLVLLGDLKHTIGGLSFQEMEEVPSFLERLVSRVGSVDLVLGNHDGGLEGSVPTGVHVHNHLVVGGVGMTHGHSWPSEEVMACPIIVLGHNHPTVMFIDELGQRSTYPCWLRAPVDAANDRVVERYPGARKGAVGIVMPAFDDLGRGTPVNLRGVKLLGPLLANGVLDTSSAGVHLLDGTYLGRLPDILVEDNLFLEGLSGPPSGPQTSTGDKGEGGGDG